MCPFILYFQSFSTLRIMASNSHLANAPLRIIVYHCVLESFGAIWSHFVGTVRPLVLYNTYVSLCILLVKRYLLSIVIQ